VVGPAMGLCSLFRAFTTRVVLVGTAAETKSLDLWINRV
jgi:hypothetical protein